MKSSHDRIATVTIDWYNLANCLVWRSGSAAVYIGRDLQLKRIKRWSKDRQDLERTTSPLINKVQDPRVYT